MSELDDRRARRGRRLDPLPHRRRDPRVHRVCSRARATRPSPASSVGRPSGSTSSPTSARKLVDDPGADPERGRGDPALGGAVADPGPLGDARRSRCTARVIPAGLEGRVAHRRRRTATSACSPIPTRIDVERAIRPPRRVRLRHPLLPRRRARPARRPHRARGDVQALPDVGRRRRPLRDGAHEHRPRLRQGPDRT